MSLDIENKIKIILKQNEAIYNSLLAKNIQFNKLNINNELPLEEKIVLLSEENEKLKNISKSLRPLQEIKIPKPVIIEKPELEDENYEEPIKKFNTITNMEDIKRAFFNNDYQLFNELIINFNFRYYRAEYKYSNEKDGAPEYIAKNLVKGFIRSLDDYRKYLMVCFRCYKEPNNCYSYKSLWIINSNDNLHDIIESLYDDYIFFEEIDIPKFLNDIQKIDNDNCLVESYVH
jgi:hypothetical protein